MKLNWTAADDLQNPIADMPSAIAQVVSDQASCQCLNGLASNRLWNRPDHLLELTKKPAVASAAIVASMFLGCSSHSTPASGEEIERAVYSAEQASVAAKGKESEEKSDLQVQELALIGARVP